MLAQQFTHERPGADAHKADPDVQEQPLDIGLDFGTTYTSKAPRSQRKTSVLLICLAIGVSYERLANSVNTPSGIDVARYRTSPFIQSVPSLWLDGWADIRKLFISRIEQKVNKVLNTGGIVASSPLPSLDPFSRRQWEIPGSIGQIPTAAFPDYGSSRDIVSHDFVKKHLPNHTINSKSACDFKMPNGKLVRSLGELQLPFQFEGESVAYIRSFAVLKTCVHNVILGKTFLRLTKTLTHFPNRLKEKVVRCLGSRRMHLVGNPEEVLGQIDGYLTSACPDTGSDIMAMSSHLCQQRGYSVDDSQENKIKVQFADGSFGWTQGKVSGIDWRFGHDQSPSDSFTVDFYVLPNLPCDVILSNEFLFDNNVFDRFEEFFVRGEEDEDGFDSFYLIQRVSESLLSKVKKLFKREPPLGMYSSSQITSTELTIPLVNVNPVILSREEREDSEMHRRAQADQAIRNLQPSERAAARIAENNLRKQYDLSNPPIPR